MLDATDRLLHAEQLLQERRLNASREAYNHAEYNGADQGRCAAGRWMIAMLEGRFGDAWQESDAIRFRGGPDPHRFWNGEDLRGARVIVRSLHGFGDAVQMLRYAPMLNAMASEILFEVPPRFVELAQCFDGVNEVITWDEAAPATMPEWDVQLEVMELPYIFRTTLKDLPISTNYVRLPPEIVRRASRAMSFPHTSRQKLRIGLVWTGSDWNPDRSVPFSLIDSFLQNTSGEFWSTEFWNLQVGIAALEASGTNLRDASSECGSGLLALAATIANLDLVITIDTLAAHLAGALGKPAWVLLQHAADWRWMFDRADNPWYPNVRLFRQRRQDDWSSVMQEVQDALKRLLVDHAPGQEI